MGEPRPPEEPFRGVRASEVIAQLQALVDEHGDLPVRVEGCDCEGACKGVAFVELRPEHWNPPFGAVMLERG